MIELETAQTKHWLLEMTLQLKDCIQCNLLTLDLTICGEFWLLGQNDMVEKLLRKSW